MYFFSLLFLGPQIVINCRYKSVFLLVQHYYNTSIFFFLFFLQDRIYWSDLEDEAIYSVNRLTGHDISMLAQHLNSPLDVVVFHELRQPKGPTQNTRLAN